MMMAAAAVRKGRKPLVGRSPGMYMGVSHSCAMGVGRLEGAGRGIGVANMEGDGGTPIAPVLPMAYTTRLV